MIWEGNSWKLATFAQLDSINGLKDSEGFVQEQCCFSVNRFSSYGTVEKHLGKTQETARNKWFTRPHQVATLLKILK